MNKLILSAILIFVGTLQINVASAKDSVEYTQHGDGTHTIRFSDGAEHQHGSGYSEREVKEQYERDYEVRDKAGNKSRESIKHNNPVCSVGFGNKIKVCDCAGGSGCFVDNTACYCAPPWKFNLIAEPIKDTNKATCESCGGTGVTGSTLCSSCGGTGSK
jgi:hypothetical protein